ncbi:MAG: hypothetical protein VX498_05380 [Myxococcota bacterium]|nr:hypothetical protein [Myxococcota bacterium]
MRDAITFTQIEQILEILDDRDINRELIEIPLGCRDPGSVQAIGTGKIRVVVPASGDFDSWLAGVEDEILSALGYSEEAGDIVP